MAWLRTRRGADDGGTVPPSSASVGAYWLKGTFTQLRTSVAPALLPATVNLT